MSESQRADSRQTLLELLVRVEHEKVHPGHDCVSLQETCGSIVRQAGEVMALAGQVDLFEESYLIVAPEIDLPEFGVCAALAGPSEAREFINKCIGRMGENQSDCPNYDARKRRLRNHVSKHLPPCHQIAYDQYQEAAQAHGGFLNDERAYELANLRHRDMPKFDSWVRYVRAARKHYNNKKNYPRHGRMYGRSVVKASEVWDTPADD
jgi:hypothetical protein